MVCAGHTSGPWDPSEVKRIIGVWCRVARVIERWIWVTLVSPLVIILSLKFHFKLKCGLETIQTLFHIYVDTLLIIMYAHCMNRQVINATSCPLATAVVQPDALVLHLLCFKRQAIQKQTPLSLLQAQKEILKIIYW